MQEDDVVKYLRALLMIQLHSTSEGDVAKPEVLLSKAGLSHGEIATILMKNPGAIAKSISRAKR